MIFLAISKSFYEPVLPLFLEVLAAFRDSTGGIFTAKGYAP